MGKDKDSGNSFFGNVIGTNHGTVVQSVSFGGVTQVTVNGKNFPGNTVVQRDGRTYVNGTDVSDELGTGTQLNITVQGNVEKLKVEGSGSVKVMGDAGTVKTMSGTVEVAGKVSGNVESLSGTIKCGQVAGSVKTMSGTVMRG